MATTKTTVAKDEQLTYTVPEVARKLGVADSTAYKAAREGQLPGAFSFRGVVRIAKKPFDRFMESPTAQ